jgi:D-glycero-D-manno-heptose 1,7-bisphosphate phosphatase
LQHAEYLLFLISNQPSYAKGKTSLANLKAVQQAFENHLQAAGIHFTEHYYCYHHPQGVVPGYSGVCECRKPSPFFVQEAFKKYAFEKDSSWMIGDRGLDIECGQKAGLRTIRIRSQQSMEEENLPPADYQVENLTQAAEIVLKS